MKNARLLENTPGLGYWLSVAVANVKPRDGTAYLPHYGVRRIRSPEFR
jgi:hypothetical protein